MSRIRYLKPDFFKDEDVAELPVGVRLFYMGLWCFADRAGRLEDRPRRLKAEIYPYEKFDVEEALATLAHPKTNSRRPFIARYEVGGCRYIQILQWDRHQRPHHTEKESDLPPLPNGYLTVKEPLRPDGDGEGNGEGIVSTTPKTATPKNTKTKFGEFVLLTPEEHAALVKRFGEAEARARIERLNNYIGSTGRQYKSHYHTVLSWAQKDQRDGAGAEKAGRYAKL